MSGMQHGLMRRERVDGLRVQFVGQDGQVGVFIDEAWVPSNCLVVVWTLFRAFFGHHRLDPSLESHLWGIVHGLDGVVKVLFFVWIWYVCCDCLPLNCFTLVLSEVYISKWWDGGTLFQRSLVWRIIARRPFLQVLRRTLSLESVCTIMTQAFIFNAGDLVQLIIIWLNVNALVIRI